MALRATAHSPISRKEFESALDVLWDAGGGKHVFRRLGFAISGGVDSMALAHLWHRSMSCRQTYRPFVQGFVVDHGLRPESAEEARVVASRLEPLLGRPGQILTLDWSRYGGVENIRSIETTARKLRFQALGQVARALNLQWIFMGHHADDLVETALFRLINGSQGTGLLGTKIISNIPECEGQFGIQSSGSFGRPSVYKEHCRYVGGPEKGGIKIGRPLLDFPKSRLIASCEDYEIKWVEDDTNKDVKLTPRNAIRAMADGDLLPRALQFPSIKSLIKDINETDKVRKDLVRKLYAATKIDSFDLRSGVMCLHLPGASTVTDLLKQYPDQNIVPEAFSVLLHSLVECVSAKDVRLETLKPTSAVLYNELITGSCISPETALSVGQIIIERTEPSVLNNEQHIGLRLHRAPPSRSSFKEGSPNDILLPPSQESDTNANNESDTNAEKFHLWDGRWWMRVRNRSSVPLRIEALDQHKIHTFRSTMFGYRWYYYTKLFPKVAPGSSKWTIPVIVCDELPSFESMKLHFPEIRKSHLRHSADRKKQAYEATDTESLRRYLAETVEPSNDFTPLNLPQTSHLLGSASPTKSFIVAIPTMGIFLNPYWESNLHYDIRYKAIPLTDMKYESSYRMVKPITTVNTIKPRHVLTSAKAIRHQTRVKKSSKYVL